MTDERDDDRILDLRSMTDRERAQLVDQLESVRKTAEELRATLDVYTEKHASWAATAVEKVAGAFDLNTACARAECALRLFDVLEVRLWVRPWNANGRQAAVTITSRAHGEIHGESLVDALDQLRRLQPPA